MTRKNFSFRYEWQQAIADLDPEIRLEVYEQTINYAATGKLNFTSGIAALAFERHILPDFERRAKAAEYRRKRKERLQAEAAISENSESSEYSENSESSENSECSENSESSDVTPTPMPNRRERRLLAAVARRHAKRRRLNHPRAKVPK